MSDDQNQNQKTNNNFGAAVVGAAVGAAVAGAAAVLSDKDNRDKIAETAKKVMADSEKKFDELKDKASDMVDAGKEELADKLTEAAKKLSE